MRDQKKDNELSGSLRPRFSTEKKSFSELLREIQKNLAEADPLRFAHLSGLNASSVEASLRGHARPSQEPSVAASVPQTADDAYEVRVGQLYKFIWPNVPAVAPPSPGPAMSPGNTAPAPAPTNMGNITVGVPTTPAGPAPSGQPQGGVSVKRREDYERGDKERLTVCPGCGTTDLDTHHVYCCDACWTVVRDSMGTVSTVNAGTGRAYVFRYFETVRAMSPMAVVRKRKYPNECPCGILSSMCDYHKGL